MNKIVVFLKGILMGACDVVPGVSGGTIAFITGIYERLIDAINGFDSKALTLFFTGKRKKFWKHIDGGFLFPLFLGIFIAIISFAKLIQFLLASQPVAIRAFFGGLLLASIRIIERHLPKFTTKLAGRAVIGTIFGYVFTSIPLTQVEPTLGTTFGAGMVAIMAMVLPGISGSYILLMVNHYQHIINNLVATIDGVKEAIVLAFGGQVQGAIYHLTTLPRDTIGVFIVGAIIGLLAFIKVLHRIKARYHDQLIATLLGVMVGALHKVRPRKEVVSSYIDRHGHLEPLVTNNVLPPTVESGLRGLLFVVLGFAMVLGIEKMGKKS